jgi:hypothetical protein
MNAIPTVACHDHRTALKVLATSTLASDTTRHARQRRPGRVVSCTEVRQAGRMFMHRCAWGERPLLPLTV